MYIVFGKNSQAFTEPRIPENFPDAVVYTRSYYSYNWLQILLKITQRSKIEGLDNLSTFCFMLHSIVHILYCTHILFWVFPQNY